MNINNYWSKKSPEIAFDIFKKNLKKNNIIMDPFLGSGTSLEGIKKLNFNVKFIGVDLNQMPLEYAAFGVNHPKLDNLLQVKKEFSNFYNKNKSFYEFSFENNKIFELDKVILDFPGNHVKVKSFFLKSSKGLKIFIFLFNFVILFIEDSP